MENGECIFSVFMQREPKHCKMLSILVRHVCRLPSCFKSTIFSHDISWPDCTLLCMCIYPSLFLSHLGSKPKCTLATSMHACTHMHTHNHTILLMSPHLFLPLLFYSTLFLSPLSSLECNYQAGGQQVFPTGLRSAVSAAETEVSACCFSDSEERCVHLCGCVQK